MVLLIGIYPHSYTLFRVYRASEVGALAGKLLASDAHNVRSIPETHMAEGENLFL